MYIANCPIPFHDLMEIVEFLTSLSPDLLCMFDGCTVDMLDYTLMFYVRYSGSRYYLSYRVLS